MDFCTAAVLTSYKQALEFRKYPVPEPGPGEALIRVEMAGICGTDVHLADGELDIPLPVILGHETVGRIENLGHCSNAIGVEARCRQEIVSRGQAQWCAVNVTTVDRSASPRAALSARPTAFLTVPMSNLTCVGGYSEFILLRAGTAIFRIPDAISTAAVVGAGCALTTVLHGLERATVTLGDVVVIQEAALWALAALAVALQSGASKVIVIGAPQRRLDFAREFGAHSVISVEEATTPEARRRLVSDQIGPYGADVVVECVGRPSAVPEGWELCRDGGKYLVLGQYANAGEVLMNPHVITRKQLQVIGSWGFEPRHVDAALRLLENKHWQTQFANEVTDRYPLRQANEALQKARLGNGGKTVITP